jgi:hypothetical protein
MKKMKMFFAVAILTLVTAGVFAGKSKLFATFQTYAFVSATDIVPVGASGATLTNLSTVSTGNLVTITANGNTAPVAIYQVSPFTFEGYAYTTATF